MRLLSLLAAATVLWSAAFLIGFTPAAESTEDAAPADDAEWSTLKVPGRWEELDESLADHDGFAWYRCKFDLPANWKGERVELRIEKVDNAHAAYVNGAEVGRAGGFPPNYRDASAESHRFVVDPQHLRFGEPNVVAVRVYDHDGHGGFEGFSPAIVGEKRGIWLSGTWEFRTDDNLEWATAKPEEVRDVALRVIALPAFKFEQVASTDDAPLPPEESVKRMTTPDDLTVEAVLAEPQVKQPLEINFDERGRMWVVNYEQYPNPAGLKMLSRDKHWRAVYDKVPLPPPHGAKGRDRVSIHEDTDGDGAYDRHTNFLDDLNIATAIARGRGGVWVLNPPYLLFYADADGDDVPDGDPEVHLEGFGIEDTHSCANNLRFGPDGWLYGAQGSTVSGNVRKPGEKEAVFSMGQNIWRYHPEKRIYEIFAEGGGNAFGVEFDAQGRVFSGHNGGNTRGFHYVQGGYYRKGFGKHGPLSNPYAFGYFPHMEHHDVPRFTHTFLIYEGTALPEQYHGDLFGVEPLQGQVVRSEISDHGSTFKTEDLERPLTSTEKRFRPVDIKTGPDGAVYVADFFEPQISHREHFAGVVASTDGRVYRLKAKDAPPLKPFDLGQKSSRELVELLKSPDKWSRRTALRLLGDRKDESLVPHLRESIAEDDGQFALECLWALHQTEGLDETFAAELLEHPFPPVREWTIRLSCDDEEASTPLARQFAERAKTEPDVRVRSQLACSAKRLSAENGLPIVAALLTRDEDASDPHLPLLLWWAIESKCDSAPDAVVALFGDQKTWQRPIVQQTILERLMRRFALAGRRSDLIVCAKLFQLAPNEAAVAELMKGFEQAFRGRTLSGLPDELVAALAKVGGGSLSLRLRQGDADALDEAIRVVQDTKQDADQRLELIMTFGEIDEPRVVPVLLERLDEASRQDVLEATLTALQAYPEERIGAAVVERLPKLPEEVRDVAFTLLGSRANWTRQLLQAVDGGTIAASLVPVEVVRKMTLHQDETIANLIAKHWSDVEGATNAEMQARVRELSELVASGSGDPYGGKDLFAKSCGKCHLLYGEGGRVGPDLTPFKRDDLVNLLINVVNPSAEIREGFETWLVITDEGRVLNGFLADRDDKLVVLRGGDGRDVRIPTDSIEEMTRQPKSIMPEGLLKNMTDAQIRDLFAYLRSTQPIN